MAQVILFKKINKYVDKEGKEKNATNFYLQAGDLFIPVEVKYFPNKETGIDTQYSSRKTVLSAFAELLLDKPKKDASDNTKSDEEDDIADSNLPF